MTINPRLLEKGRAAAARLAESERQVALARSEYHSIVRRMHLAGASLREVAQELGLSHQRVQQMVDGEGGSWWQRVWRSRNIKGNLICTFCGRTQHKVARLIAGPKVFICDECVALAGQKLKGDSRSATAGSFAPAGEESKARCSFCRKRRSAQRQMLVGPSANICGECLDVCRQILIDSSP